MTDISEQQFKPEQFMYRTGTAKIDAELRKWICVQPAALRIQFIEELFSQNHRYALSILRASQLPLEEVARLLEHWLISASHNCSQGLIEGLVPMLGEKRFWSIAARADFPSEMANFLNYHSDGLLKRYQESIRA